jgi:TonB family protein
MGGMVGLLLVLLARAQPHEELPPLLREPELISFVQAAAPAPATDEIRVLLLLEIDAAGAVSRVEVLRPGAAGFDEAAVAAALQFRFSAAQDETGPVPVAVEFEYVFPAEPAPAEPAEPAEPELAPLSAQGLLKEMGTRLPIEGAALQVSGPDGAVLAEARTGEGGRFELRGLPPGTWRVEIRRPGYQQAHEELVIAEGQVTELTLWARNLSYRDNEVIVVYERARDPEITRRTLSMGEVRRVPGTFGDPVRVIQSLPGAARAPFAGGLLVLRGSNPDDSNVYVDGVEVPLVYHLGGFRSILNPDLISAVDYLPGGYGVRYGRSIGGVVDVRTQDDFPERGRATARVDLLDAGGYAEGRAGKLGFAVGARRAYIDAVLALALKDQEYQASPRWMDYQLKLAWLPARTARGGELSLLLFGFDDKLTVKGAALERQVGVSNSTHRVVLRWEQVLTDTLTFSVQPSAGVVGTNIAYGTDVSFELDASLLDLRSELDWQPGKAFSAQLGTDSEAARNDFQLFLAGRPIDDDNPLSEEEPVSLGRPTWQTTPDPYLQATLSPLGDPEALALVAGARLAMLSRTNHEMQRALDTRVSLRARLLPGGTLKAGTGLYHQPPAGIDLGRNKAFDKALSAEAGWEQQITPAISADVTGFWRKRMDPDTEGPLLEVPADGRAYGTELMVRHALVDRFFGWVSYTLSRSERTDDPGDPEDWYPYDFDQTHIFTAVAGYGLPWDFEISGRGQYVTGNPYTPFDGGVHLVDQGRWLGFPSADTNGARQPPYWAVDLRLDKLFTFRHWQLEIFLDLLNVVHGENPEFQLYNYDYTETDYVRGLPFLPALGAQVEVDF